MADGAENLRKNVIGNRRTSGGPANQPCPQAARTRRGATDLLQDSRGLTDYRDVGSGGIDGSPNVPPDVAPSVVSDGSFLLVAIRRRRSSREIGSSVGSWFTKSNLSTVEEASLFVRCTALCIQRYTLSSSSRKSEAWEASFPSSSVTLCSRSRMRLALRNHIFPLFPQALLRPCARCDPFTYLFTCPAHSSPFSLASQNAPGQRCSTCHPQLSRQPQASVKGHPAVVRSLSLPCPKPCPVRARCDQGRPLEVLFSQDRRFPD